MNPIPTKRGSGRPRLVRGEGSGRPKKVFRLVEDTTGLPPVNNGGHGPQPNLVQPVARQDSASPAPRQYSVPPVPRQHSVSPVLRQNSISPAPGQGSNTPAPRQESMPPVPREGSIAPAPANQGPTDNRQQNAQPITIDESWVKVTFPPKEIVMKKVMKVPSLMNQAHCRPSDKEEHFGSKWKICFSRWDDFSVGLLCDDEEKDFVEWFLDIDVEFRVILPDGEKQEEKKENITLSKSNPAISFPVMPYDLFKDKYPNGGDITIECRVTIFRSYGARFYTDDFRILVPSKLLSEASTMLAKICRSQGMWLAKNADRYDILRFYDVVHQKIIEEKTVERILLVAKCFKAWPIISRCEQFLLQESRKPLKKKFEIALLYNMQELKETCIAEATEPLEPMA